MKFRRPNSEVFVPSSEPAEAVLARTTHLAVGAHADDVEIFAVEGILARSKKPENHFCAAIVSDGSGSPRADVWNSLHSDADVHGLEAGLGVGQGGEARDLVAIRRAEQRRAAMIGGYSAAVLLDYESAQVKDPQCVQVIDDLEQLLRSTRPHVLYTHVPTDRHDTHVAVCVRVLSALARLAPSERPERVIGCEVWGDLDWMPDSKKVVMDVGQDLALQSRLLRVFESQLAGGKRYDLAALGRRRAHATFGESHRVDQMEAVILGMDLLPILARASGSADLGRVIETHVESLVEEFREDIVSRLRKTARTGQ